MRTNNANEGEPEPCRCAPCSASRVSASPTPLLVLGIVALNYVPNVLWSLEVNDENAGSVIAVVLFHIFVGLMVLAWAYTCFTDPGVPTERWQRQMAALANAGQEVRVCRKSGLYKPPRAHFCSVTRRLTLNMDHFCPWVVNTVGFYNKKFFILFLLYACLAVSYSLVALAAQLPALWKYANELGEEGNDRWLPGVLNVVLLVGAMLLDIILLLVLGPFLGFHLKMARRNQTTIDGDRYPQYDLGRARNLRSVFGRDRWVWLLPCYCAGPDGDGVHWPTADARACPETSAVPSHAVGMGAGELAGVHPTEQPAPSAQPGTPGSSGAHAAASAHDPRT